MIRVPKLLGLMAEKGISQKAIANELGMNAATFYRKMKRGVFDSDEICRMITLLEIEDPADIFFAGVGA